MATSSSAALQSMQTTIQTANFVVTPVISDSVKDAWNKLVSDLRGSGVPSAVAQDLREGITDASATLKKDLQAAGVDLEKSVQQEFAAFRDSTSASMDNTTKSIYINLMNNADASATTIANRAISDTWKEVDDFSVSLNAILDDALKQKNPDLNKVAGQITGAIQKEFGDLVNDMKNNLSANYQKAVVDISLAAGAAGIFVTKDQFTQFENNVVTAVAADLLIDSAKTGKDLTVDFAEMTLDIANTVNKNKDSLLKIAIVDGANLIQATVKTVASTLKKWFKW